MHKVWAVIRREFLAEVRTRAFIIATILLPLAMLAFATLPYLLSRRETGPKEIAIVDAAGGSFGAAVERVLADAHRANGRPYYHVVRIPAAGRLEAVRDSLVRITGLSDRKDVTSLDGVLIASDEAVDSGRVTYLGANVGSPGDMNHLETTVEPIIRRERLTRAGIAPAVIERQLGAVSLETKKVTDGRITGESGEASFLLAYFMAFALYLTLLIYGMRVMSSIVEEKSSRIAEVLVASLTPFQMMLGKVVGVGSGALLQIGIWAGTATLVSTYGRALGIGSEAAGPSFPTMSPALLAVFLVFFVLGFLLYSACYAAIGAMCNSPQEAQQSHFPITMFIAFGLMTVFALLGESNGSLAKGLSLVPFLAPFVVPVRYSIAPLPLGEVLISLLTTVAGVLAVVWIASRIYRVGILLYGKRPNFPELLRWVRAK